MEESGMEKEWRDRPLNLEQSASPAACPFDPVLEKRVRRKLDLNLLPLVTGLYLLAFLDRSNIGNAKIAGMDHDLHLDSNDYQWLLTIFYIAYIVGEPLIVAWKFLKPHYWASFVVFVWGLSSSCLAATQSWAGAMALRFLMGVSEAAYGPGTVYLLTFFYRRNEVGFRSGIFLSAAPLASTFAGALAYGITSGHAALASWRLLFLVEGLPTLVMVPVTFFFLPDSPDTARFLNAEEKEYAKARSTRQLGRENATGGGFSFKESLKTLADAKAWITALMYFSTNVSFASLPVYLPTLLADLGYTSISAQGLTAPPYFLSFLVTVTSVYLADRTQQRGFFIMSFAALGMVGYIVLATVTSTGVRYFATFLVAAGVFPTIANILPWVSNNQGSDEGRGAAFVLLNLVGQCGPILGTRLYPASEAPRYVTGHAVCAGFLGFVVCLAAGLRLLLVWENRVLDRRWGKMDQSHEGQKEDEGEDNFGPKFRFVL